jgi:pyridoxine 4-dehydrogenase
MTTTHTLGGTIEIGDISAHRLGFGAMRITGKGVWGPPEDPEEVREVLRRTRELGIDLIDTANSYGPEVSEELIAEVLHPYEGLSVATKGGLVRGGPNQWSPNGQPGHLRAACESSLKRLRVDTIDLYQLHKPDPEVPYEESVGTLRELQEEGKIRNVGISNVNTDELETARGIVEVVSVQNRFNLADRGGEEVLDRAEQLGLAFFPWFPLAAGDLAEPGGAAAEIAEAHDASPGQVALAWLLRRSPSIVPIPGTSSVAHLEENVEAASIELTDEEFERLDQAS